MGLMGLGLAWRAAARFAPLSISPWIGYSILVFGGILLLFMFACYLSKISVRPRVIIEDMATVPGRAGVSAMTLSLLLFAAAMAPLSPLVATATLFMGLIGHTIIAILALFIMARTPQGLVVSPAWHLSFVGFIVACLSAAPLGYAGFAQLILGATVLASAIIYGISLIQLSKADVPAPLRPLQAIHLAPLSLFASVAVLLGHSVLALIFATLAIGLASVLASRARFLTSAGFSPLWGAFTFPAAAFSIALFSVSTQVGLFGWLAFLPLALVTIITPIIVLRVLRMWSTGALAAKTGAAVA
jgi:tellurite resistance protein